MPVPSTLEKTWQFSVNRAHPAAGVWADLLKDLALDIKAQLKGFASNPCTVRGSSDGTAAGLDGVDRVLTRANLVMATGAHSWWVLRWPALGLEVCWDWNSANAWQGTIVASLAGFTGGSTTARPTATDQQVLVSSNDWGPSTSNAQHVVDVIHAEDGRSTHVLLMSAGNCRTHWVFSEVVNTVTGWATPVVVAHWTGNPVSWSPYYNTAVGFKGWRGATLLNLQHSGLVISPNSQGGNAQPIVTYMTSLDAMTSEWHFGRMGLYCSTTGSRGRHGRIPDFWAAPSAISSGTRFPANDATGIAIVLDDTLIPWNGSAAVIS